MTTRQIHLAAFLIAGNTAHSHAIWRHPLSQRGGFLQPEYYQKIAETLERGKFDMAFFADRLAMSARFGDSIEVGARYGDQDATRLDPVLVVSLMAANTRNLGLAVTRSTTYHHPYNIARTFSTLDHLSQGRAGWNVVTSVNEAEARNHGLDAHPEHDARYDAADEFMELTFNLWNGWEEDALVLDQEAGIYADPAKIHPAEFNGRDYRCQGALNIPRSPQGRPVIIQAGSSSRGKNFAAKWAEVIFALQPTAPALKRFYQDVKTAATEAGRGPDEVKILAATMPFVAKTRGEADENRARHNELIQPLVGLSTMSSHMNFDFAKLPLDEPIADITVQGMQGMLAAVKNLADSGQTTLREIGKRYGESVIAPQIVGTPADIADQLEVLFLEKACDGFMVTPTHLPFGFDAFVDGVVPELQRRGLFRSEYRGHTLRENLRDA
jgi:FMN-dependent oxidoreductase (nitrilotriacetate monooxygenase family)